MNRFKESLESLFSIYPKISKVHLTQYVYDIYIYDRGVHIEDFIKNAKELRLIYEEDLQEIALRTLAKTYFIKDEVFIAHIMASSLKKREDEIKFGHLGESYKVVHINRPSFDFGKIKFEFDFSPRTWMLRLMRHMRILRLILPTWHREEKNISKKVREQLFRENTKEKLIALDNIKGFRDVRYKNAQRVF